MARFDRLTCILEEHLVVLETASNFPLANFLKGVGIPLYLLKFCILVIVQQASANSSTLRLSSHQVIMDYMNSTLVAAATLLPYGTHLQHAKYQMMDISPSSIQLPTNLFAIFDRAWTLINGQSTDEFRFIPEQTPLATFKEAGGAIATYYLIIFGGREIMRNLPAVKLNKLFIAHNFCLTAISGGLLLLFAQQLIPGLWENGLYDGVCGATGWSQQLLVLYYVNYLTKYLELLDTVFLVLKKKPLTFLHTYHHGATALLCYTQLVGQTSVSWVPITLNLAVHVVMYW